MIYQSKLWVQEHMDIVKSYQENQAQEHQSEKWGLNSLA